MSEFETRQQNKEDDDDIVIDFGVLFCDLWKGFKKFWWLCLIICSLAAGLNLARTVIRYVPMYQSKVSFTVSTQSSYDETNTSYSFYYSESMAQQLVKLFPYILQSDAMQELMKEELGTDVINGSISATAVADSNLFTMQATSSDPASARQILEAAMTHLPEITKYVIGETRLNVIQPASTPTTPYNAPNYRRAVQKGLLAGAAASCILLGLYALLRSTIRKEEDFREVLNISCWGVIPQVRFKAHSQKIDTRISIRNKKTGYPLREAFRGLALKMDRRMREKQQKVLLVTSTLPGEGKSTTAMNLALALGENGKKVLLMDLDLRSPTLASELGLDINGAGIERVLTKRLDAAEALRQEDAQLWFLGAEKPAKQVNRLLTQPLLSQLIGQYRKAMDYIIIDAPPCGSMSDAATISEYCDGILYVIRQDTASRTQIMDGMQQAGSHGTPILGGVLNGAESHLAGYGAYYGYGKYGYGYGKYGYGRYGYGKYGYGGRYGQEKQDKE